MQLLLSHIFLSFKVRTSPLKKIEKNDKTVKKENLQSLAFRLMLLPSFSGGEREKEDLEKWEGLYLVLTFTLCF